MDIDELTRLIDEYEMGKKRDVLLQLARPSIVIAKSDDNPQSVTNKLGGSPDLPDGFEWPKHSAGLCKFIGQFDLSDPAFAPFGLPSNGLLSFFFTADDEGYQYWGPDDFLRVFHFSEGTTLKPVIPPASVGRGATLAVKLLPGLELPDQHWIKRNNIPWQYDYDDGYWDLRWRLHPVGRFLFGYPCYSTLGCDPTPGPDSRYSDSYDKHADWRSLLTLFSNDDMDWCWHDGDWLVTFIRDAHLRSGNFSKIQATAG